MFTAGKFIVTRAQYAFSRGDDFILHTHSFKIMEKLAQCKYRPLCLLRWAADVQGHIQNLLQIGYIVLHVLCVSMCWNKTQIL